MQGASREQERKRRGKREGFPLQMRGGGDGPENDSRDTQICQTEHLGAQFGKCKGGPGWVGWACEEQWQGHSVWQMQGW